MGFVAFYGYVEALQVQQTSQSIKDNYELLIRGTYGETNGAATPGSRVE